MHSAWVPGCRLTRHPCISTPRSAHQLGRHSPCCAQAASSADVGVWSCGGSQPLRSTQCTAALMISTGWRYLRDRAGQGAGEGGEGGQLRGRPRCLHEREQRPCRAGRAW